MAPLVARYNPPRPIESWKPLGAVVRISGVGSGIAPTSRSATLKTTLFARRDRVDSGSQSAPSSAPTRGASAVAYYENRIGSCTTTDQIATKPVLEPNQGMLVKPNFEAGLVFGKDSVAGEI